MTMYKQYKSRLMYYNMTSLITNCFRQFAYIAAKDRFWWDTAIEKYKMPQRRLVATWNYRIQLIIKLHFNGDNRY